MQCIWTDLLGKKDESNEDRVHKYLTETEDFKQSFLMKETNEVIKFY